MLQCKTFIMFFPNTIIYGTWHLVAKKPMEVLHGHTWFRNVLEREHTWFRLICVRVRDDYR